ncbi:efflux RND transporter permease subunit [Thalassoroseus pseudoceratinae]|uniref:efflux RND transporter permease subunit n=1 Tax=Thalassoroseus pseudoceratinae TaxID=2713176 RepID=UPI001423D464|nr:MMPL family transporter [Thalassoroseus pseudoceratinae]
MRVATPIFLDSRVMQRIHTTIWWRVLLLTALVPSIIVLALKIETNIDDVYQWLPDNSPGLVTYEWFLEHFGSDDVVVVSWPDCDLNDPRIQLFAGQIESLQHSRLIAEVLTGPEIVERLTSENSQLTRGDVIERLAGTLIGANGKTTCLTIRLTPSGQRHRTEAIQEIFRAAAATPGLSRKELRMAGYPYSGYVAEAAIKRAILLFTPPACLVSIIVAWFCLRNFLAVLVTLFLSGVATGAAVALIPLFGTKLDGLLTAVPSLIYVLAVSTCIHLISYLRSASETLPTEHATPEIVARRGFALAWKPSVVSSVSTAIGMGSLISSQFPAIRQFGIYSAAGTLLMLVLILLLAPGPLAYCVIGSRGGLHPPQFLQRSLWRGFRLATTKSVGVVLAIFTIAILLGMQLGNIRASVAVEDHFRSDSDYLRDLYFIESEIGPFGAVEVVLGFPDTQSSDFDQRFRQVQSIERQLKGLSDVSTTFSATTLVPLPDRLQGRVGFLARVVARKQLRDSREEMLDGAYLVEFDDREWWRITIRANEIERINLVDFESAVRAVVDEELQSAEATDVKVEYTGAAPLYLRSQKSVIRDLFQSYALAFLIIAVVMALVLRSVFAGMASMIPNVLPSVVVFGGTAALGFDFDFATIVTGSVALGIAVDDTAHFLLRYRDHESECPNDALKHTFQECAPAMLTTTLVCGLGLLVFLPSPLATQSRFAITIFCLLIVAVLSDLILVPALLSTRLGRWIFGR